MHSWKSTRLVLMLAAVLLAAFRIPAAAGDGPMPSWVSGRVGVMTLNMYIGEHVYRRRLGSPPRR
jgi:hypothetical protein